MNKLQKWTYPWAQNMPVNLEKRKTPPPPRFCECNKERVNKLRPTSTKEHNIYQTWLIHSQIFYTLTQVILRHLPSILGRGKLECMVAKLCTTNHCVASFSKQVIISSLPKAISKETQAMEVCPVDTYTRMPFNFTKKELVTGGSHTELTNKKEIKDCRHLHSELQEKTEEPKWKQIDGHQRFSRTPPPPPRTF